jgi:hypothetical protein
MKARHHPLKWRLRSLTSLSNEVASGDYYLEMADEDLVEALNLGLVRAGAAETLQFTVARGAGEVPIAELHGLEQSWLGPPQEVFFRFAELGEDAGAAAVAAAFGSTLPRAEHSGESRFERPEDDHSPRPGWRSFLRKEKKVR